MSALSLQTPTTIKRYRQPETGGACLPARTLYTAQLLIGAVRDHNANQVNRQVAPLTRQQLRELVVTLAALVPYDATLRELLAWNDEQWHVHGRKAQRLRPHGTHAAYTRHRNHGEPACDECVDAERLYQRARDRRRRNVDGRTG